jgi:hypothetical protein
MQSPIAVSLFGKPVHELLKEDLVSFFSSDKRESNTLEFKSYVDASQQGGTKNSRDKEKLSTIIRSVCGFLNTDGGILIWGSPKGEPGSDGENIYKGDLCPVEMVLAPDQFINMVVSEISPTPLRVLFASIPIEPGKYCYVIEVAASEFAPHQYKGTYYMRLDGSTRFAPHRYVEALIKRISFPKVEAFLTFGEMKTVRVCAFATVQLTIHNLSKLINDKNISYQVLVSGADLLPVDATNIAQRKGGTTIDKMARAVLHYKMPYYEHFALVLDRKDPNARPSEISLMLTVWGDLTPAIVATYKMSVYPTATGHTMYSLTKEENVYLMEKQDTLSDSERVRTSNQQLLEMFEENAIEQPIYRHIYRMDG